MLQKQIGNTKKYILCLQLVSNRKQKIKLPFSQQYKYRNLKSTVHILPRTMDDNKKKYLQSNTECWKRKIYLSDRVQQTILRTHKNTLTCLRCQIPKRKWSMELSKLAIGYIFGHITYHPDDTNCCPGYHEAKRRKCDEI